MESLVTSEVTANVAQTTCNDVPVVYGSGGVCGIVGLGREGFGYVNDYVRVCSSDGMGDSVGERPDSPLVLGVYVLGVPDDICL